MKLLIVDDEPLVRNGLCDKFRWDSIGIQEVRTACNGLEAVEIILKEQPDIVLTDIRMPGMTGMELADWLRTYDPDIAVVFLTGYSEFHYARHAVELQAAQYLLKPIEEDELFAVLGKVMDTIRENHRRKLEYEEAASFLQKYGPVLRERFLMDMLYDRLNPEEIRREYEFNQIQLSGPLYSVAKVEFSRFRPNRGYGKHEFESDKMRLLSYYAGLADQYEQLYLVPEGQHHLVLVWGIGEDGRVYPKSGDQPGLALKEVLNGWIREREGDIVRAAIGLSAFHSDLAQLHHGYIEASEALAGKHDFGREHLISFEELIRRNGPIMPVLDREHLKRAMFSGEPKQVHDFLRKHFQYVKHQAHRWVRNEFMIFDLIAAVTDVFKVHAPSQANELEFSLIDGMIKAETSDELETDMAEFLLRCMNLLEQSKMGYSEKIVELVSDYLQANYMNNINLKTVATELSVHFSYISRVFHEKKGISFTDYLIEIRLEKAKALLLNTNYTITHISGLVGYNNEKYFSRSFKKKEGMTAQEFRQSHSGPVVG